jgi:hypothetical protein
MIFIPIIIFSDFIQVLNNAKNFYTKNLFFSKHKLFSTKLLLQEQRLNPRNYSKEELIMEIFI